MADDTPVLDQVNIITGDMRRSVDFYRRLGAVFPRPLSNPSGLLFHAGCELHGGALLELDSVEFAPVWNTGWAGRSDLQGRWCWGFASRRGTGWTSASGASRVLATASFNHPSMRSGGRGTPLLKIPMASRLV